MNHLSSHPFRLMSVYVRTKGIYTHQEERQKQSEKHPQKWLYCYLFSISTSLWDFVYTYLHTQTLCVSQSTGSRTLTEQLAQQNLAALTNIPKLVQIKILKISRAREVKVLDLTWQTTRFESQTSSLRIIPGASVCMPKTLRVEKRV